MKHIASIILAAGTSLAALQAAETKPLRALLITGGCCHDYKGQKDILKKGLEAGANIEVTQIHTDDKSTRPPLEILGNPDYAKGYDVVIHDECAADVKDPKIVAGVLAPHRAGVPGVNLHCAMHCYRVGNPGKKTEAGSEASMWFDYLGLQSSGHGPQEPITLNIVNTDHPSTRGLTNWTTIREELYNNIQVFPSAVPLMKGKQIVKRKSKDKDGNEKITEETVETVVTWANQYGATRVWSTTVGHNSATVEDPRYLEYVTRGVLWACGKLTDDGKPLPGYGPKK
jgi:hypothetical protein